MAVSALAKVWAQNTLLEALTVLFAAAWPFAIAALHVSSLALAWFLWRSNLAIRPSSTIKFFMYNFALFNWILIKYIIGGGLLEFGLKCQWISNQNLFFGKKSFVLVLFQVKAACATALRATIPVILEAFTVQLEATRVWAIARFDLKFMLLNKCIVAITNICKIDYWGAILILSVFINKQSSLYRLVEISRLIELVLLFYTPQ